MNIECSHCGAVNPAGSTFCGECGWQIMPREAEEQIEKVIASVQKRAEREAAKSRPEAKPAPSDADLGPEVPIAGPEPASGPEDLEAPPIEDRAGGEAEPEPEPGPAGLEPLPGEEPAESLEELEAEALVLDVEPGEGQEEIEGLPEEEPAESLQDLEAEALVLEVEPGEGQEEIEGLPEEEPAESFEDLEAETLVLEGEPGEGQDEIEGPPEGEPVGDEVGLEPEPFAGAPGSGVDAAYAPTAGAVSARDAVFFDDGQGVVLSSSAAVLGDRTYAWPEIVSASVQTIPAARWPSLLLAAFGAALLAFAVVTLGRISELGWVLIGGGLALLVIGLLLTVTARDQHQLRIKTPSGVETALVSSDLDRVERILLAIRGGPDGQDLAREDLVRED